MDKKVKKGWWSRRSLKVKLGIIFISFIALFFIVGISLIFSGISSSYTFNTPNNWKVSMVSDNNTNFNGTVTTLVQTNGSGEANISIIGLNSSNTINKNLTDYMNNFVNMYSTAHTNNQINSTTARYPNYHLLSNNTLNINGLTGFDMVFQTSETGLITDPPIYVEVVVLKKGNNYCEVQLDYSPNVTTPYAHNDFMTLVSSLKIN